MLTAVFNADWTLFSAPAEVTFKGYLSVGIEFDAGRFQRAAPGAISTPFAHFGIDVLDSRPIINAESRVLLRAGFIAAWRQALSADIN
jgi:hypothetical protein